MKIRLLLTAATALLAGAGSGQANAAALLFTFSGPSGTAVFQLDSNPTPPSSSSFLGFDQFAFFDVPGTFGGIAGTASTISFGNGIFAALSINAANLGFTQFSGPTLFTGPGSAPVFTPGSFTLINPFFGNGALTIAPVQTPVQSAVPEPAAWGMMLFGFGLAGAALRRRRRSLAVSLA